VDRHDAAPAGADAPGWVATVLRDRILAGALPPGSPLREVAIADEFGVSRNTLRVALLMLAGDNVVEIQRHRGARVRVMSPEDIRDIFIVRRTLELRAIEESGQASPASLARLSAAADEVEASVIADDWARVATAGLSFHQSVVGLLGSPRLDAIFLPIVAQIRLAYGAVHDQADFHLPFASRDREICDLVAAGSRAAAGAMLRGYLDEAESAFVELVSLGSDESAPRDGGR